MLIVAAAKYYIINMLKIFSSEKPDEQTLLEYLSSRYLLSNMTSILALLFMGNLIDNVSDHKRLVTICNLTLASLYLTFGIFVIFEHYFNSLFNTELATSLSSNLSLLIDFFEPTIFIIVWLQLFNWFSKK